MYKSLECVPVEQLKELALGRLPDPPASSVEQHVLGCEPCAEATLNLVADETLVGAMRGMAVAAKPSVLTTSAGEEIAGSGLAPRPERVSQLIQRLRDLPTRELSDVDSATVLSGEAGLDAMPDIDWSTCFAASQSADEIGRLADFRVLKLLGHGGMGGVFLAEDMQLGRRVALKIMRPEFASRPGATERFLREAKAVAAVHDEHIVTIYQVGQAAIPGQKQGVPFLAQELLHGEALDARLKREGQLPVDEAVSIARQIAAGLAAAHERGLIHRDIKPANVFLEGSRLQSSLHESSLHAPREESRGETRVEGTPGAAGANATVPSIVSPHAEREGYKAKLLDFGLARPVSDTENLTQSGMILGTPAYMAPEQARGETVDARADLFSLGCVLYRMLTGRAAFGGKDVMVTLMSLANDTPPAPHTIHSDVPRELSDLVMSLLAKDRDARPASAREVMRRMDTPARPILDVDEKKTRTGKSAHPTRRIGVALLSLAALTLLAVVIVKIKTKDGKETEVAINVPGNVSDVTTKVREEGRLKSAPVKLAAAAGPSPFDALDPAAIPAEERLAWQPKELVAVLGSHRQRMWTPGAETVAISGDGTLALTGGFHGKPVLWRTQTGEQQPSPTPPNLISAAISPNGKTLYSFSDHQGKESVLMIRDGDAWTSRPMSLQKAINKGLSQTCDATFSVNGRWLATSILHEMTAEQSKYATYVWDVSVDPPKRVIDLHGYTQPNISSDGQRLAVISTEDYSLRIFDISALPAKQQAIVPEMEFPRELASRRMSRHGFLASGNLAAIDKSGLLAIWDVSASEPKRLAQRDMTAVSGYHLGISLQSFRTGTDRLLISTPDAIQTWRPSRNSLDLEFERPFKTGHDGSWINPQAVSVSVSDDGQMIASLHKNGMVRFWAFSEKGLREVHPIHPQPVIAGGAAFPRLVISNDGTHFVTSSEDGFQVWRVNGPACQRLECPNLVVQESETIGFTNATQFTTAGFPESHLWKIEGNRVVSAGRLSSQLISLAATNDGLIVSLDHNKPTSDLSLWQMDKAPGKRICTWTATAPGGHVSPFHSRGHYSLSDDGRKLATVDFVNDRVAEPVIRIWQRSDKTTAPTEFAKIMHPGQIWQLRLSPDGRFLAVAAQSGLSLWKLQPDQPQQLWHQWGYHHAVAFSPDSRHIASSCVVSTAGFGSGAVSVVDTSGDVLYESVVPVGPCNPTDLAFAPDGRHLLTANSNGTVYILRLPELAEHSPAK